jgi:hypothetical protein
MCDDIGGQPEELTTNPSYNPDGVDGIHAADAYV